MKEDQDEKEKENEYCQPFPRDKTDTAFKK